MALPTLPFQAILIALCALGCYLTWGFAMKNGTINMMEHIRDTVPPVLPGTDALLKQYYIGIRAVDYQLTVLTLFFWEMVDGSMPHASLNAFRFGGQMVAAWGLLMIESARNGNKGRLVSYISLWGVLVQNATYAMTIPLYLALYLSTSPTVPARKASLVADMYEVASIPLSLVCGFVVPAVVLSLPAPSMQSYESKQTWIAIWQAFPLWVSGSQQVVKRCIQSMWPQGYRMTDSTSPTTLRVVYGFLLVCAGVTQVATVTLSLTSLLFPGIFASEYVGVLNPQRIAVPVALTPSTKMASVGSGSFMFLQYDEMVGSAAVLLWATFMFANSKSADQTLGDWGGLAARIAFLTALTGPIGCALALLWARDELVFREKSR